MHCTARIVVVDACETGSFRVVPSRDLFLSLWLEFPQFSMDGLKREALGALEHCVQDLPDARVRVNNGAQPAIPVCAVQKRSGLPLRVREGGLGLPGKHKIVVRLRV